MLKTSQVKLHSGFQCFTVDLGGNVGVRDNHRTVNIYKFRLSNSHQKVSVYTFTNFFHLTEVCQKGNKLKQSRVIVSCSSFSRSLNP